MKNSLKTIFIIIAGCILINASNKASYIIKACDIQNISNYYGTFKCYGRTWYFESLARPHVKNNSLVIHFLDMTKSSVMINTLPGELNEPAIKILKKKNIVIEFNEIIKEHMEITFESVTNEFDILRINIDCYNKKVIKAPLPTKGSSLNSLHIIFTYKPYVYKIRSVYLE